MTSVCWWKGTERWECMALSGTHGSRTWGQQIIMITFPNYFFFVLQTQVILYLTFVPCELTVKELFMVIWVSGIFGRIFSSILFVAIKV